MSNLKFYKITSILLLLINLGFIVFFFATKPPLRPVGDSQRLNPTVLDLSNEQQVEFRKLITNHQNEIRKINDRHHDLLVATFSKLKENENHPIDKDILDQLEKLESEKIRITYNHFNEVKSILRPNQHANFNEFMSHAMQHILGGHKKPHHPPKEF